MSSPEKNRHGVWQTRLSVPKHLQTIVRKKSLKRSLKTKDNQQAKLLHPAILAELQAILERARRILETDSRLTDAVIKSIIFDWRKSIASKFVAQHETVNPFIVKQSGFISENYEPLAMVLSDLDNVDKDIKTEAAKKPKIELLLPEEITDKYMKHFLRLHSLVGGYLERPLAGFNIFPDVKGDNYHKLMVEFAMTYISICQSAVKREISNTDLIKHGVTMLDIKPEIDALGVTMDDLWKEYKATLTQREPDRADGRIRDYSVAMRKFLSIYGSKSVANIKKRDIAKFRLLLEQLPTRPNKKVKELPLDKQIEKANKDDLPRTSATSVRNQINAISSVFTYAVSQDYIEINPVQGTVSDIKIRKTTQEGKGFSNEQLVTIFNSKLFHENHRPEKADYGEAVYWIPLILHYTGARVEEIAQLYIADINLEHDIPYIKIHGERDDQSVKTGESRRVPLHAHLIELGFAGYVNELPSNGRLFPKLTNTGTESKYNTGVRIWFSKYLHELGINHAGMKPMHDFRHSFITGCRERNTRIDVQRAITGHSQPDVASQYGSYSLELMNELIQAIPKCFDD